MLCVSLRVTLVLSFALSVVHCQCSWRMLAFSPIPQSVSQLLFVPLSPRILSYMSKYTHIQTDAILNTPNSSVYSVQSYARRILHQEDPPNIFSMHTHTNATQCGSMLKSVCWAHCFAFVSTCCSLVCVHCMHVRLFVYVCNGVVAAAEMLSNSNGSSQACVFMPMYTQHVFECCYTQSI